MTYKRGDVLISVGQVDGFGKNPSLWIGTESTNERVKVASFGSYEKAKLFTKWLDYIVGLSERDAVKWDD